MTAGAGCGPWVGAAVRTVPVPGGTPMSGYAARTEGSAGVHDPLSVRALVIDAVALVTVDCCALHERTCAEARDVVVAEGRVRDLVLHATHTHAGPCISLERLGTDAPEVRSAVVSAVIEAVYEATVARVPCTVSYAEATGVGVARNRRHLDRVIDPPVQAVGFDHEGARIVTLVSYPCHPVILDASNTLISADYIAPLRDAVEAAHPGSVCVFATGAAGDVNTGHRAEASYVAGGADRTFEEAERVGTALAAAVLGAAVLAVPGSGLGPGSALDSVTAELVTAEVGLDLSAHSPERVAEDLASWERELDRGTPRAALLEAWIRWARTVPATPSSRWTGRVSVVRCGALRIVGLPGEPFLSAADELRARHDGPVIVLGYCDGVPGYLPADDEYVHGGYEVDDAHRYYAMPAPFAQGSLERVVGIAAGMLDRG